MGSRIITTRYCSLGWICLSLWSIFRVSYSFLLRQRHRSLSCDLVEHYRHQFRIHGGRDTMYMNNRGQDDVAGSRIEDCWFPEELLLSSEHGSSDKETIQESLERQSLQFMANLLTDHLRRGSNKPSRESEQNSAYRIAQGRFQDLCCTLDGELLLESLFKSAPSVNDRIVYGAIVSLQSLLVLGTKFGVTATPDQFERSVAHLVDSREHLKRSNIREEWNASNSRKLKYECNRIPGLQLLAQLNRKRSAQGAFDFLVRIGAWQPHENLALLRSGFSLRFTDAEVRAAEEVRLAIG
eukprot:scaffold1378_cov137-Cylindrotheca_fusiformis.AAC.11